MSEGVIYYQWKGESLSEIEFIAKMRENGVQVIYTQPVPVFDENGNMTHYMSETYRVVGDYLVKEK